VNIIEVLIKAAVSPEFRGALSSATSQIQATEKTVEGMGSRTKSSFGAMASSITGTFGAVGLAISGVKQSIEVVGQTIKAALGPSAEMERLQVQFAVMLGGMGEAKTRMEELTKFADSTPFELPEVVKASKVLETLTKGALSTGEGLRMVGDVAAATGQPFDELAMWFGRLYDGLQSGRPVGEALARLQELGVVSGDVRGKIEQLQKAGKKGAEVWDVAKQAFGQYAGMMDAQSKTFEGMSSTMNDSLSGVVREFGNQILPDASGAVGEFTETLNDLKPAAAALGWVVDSVVKVFRVAFLGFRAFFQGLIPLIVSELGRLLSWSLSTMIGWAEKINGIVGKLLPKTWQDGFAANLASAKAWTEGMGSYFKDVADDSVGFLDQVAGKMGDVYKDRGEIAVPGKKSGTGSGGGAAGSGKLSAEERNQAQIDAFLNKQAAERAKHEDELAAKLFQTKLNDEKRLEVKQLETQKKLEQEEKKRADSMIGRIASFGAPLVNGLSQGIQNVLTKGHIGVASIAKTMRDGLVQAAADFIAKMAIAGIFKLIGGAVGGGIGAGMTGYGKSLLGFAVGTPRVPRDMAAMIHSGEGIIPKDFMDGIRSGELTLGGPGAGGSHSASLVLGSDIIAAIKDQGHALVKIVNNHGRVSFA
jgi:hypothetical protein